MDPAQLDKTLTHYIRSDTFPVAIKLVKPGEDLPERVKRPAQMGLKVTICQSVAMSRRYGWVVATSEQDMSCAPAAAAFGFRPMLTYMEEGHLCNQMYNASLEAGAHTEAAGEKLEHGEIECVLSAPLQRCAFEPDVVLIYGNSAQIMRLVNAALWKEGGRLYSSFAGRLDCVDEIIIPLKSGKPEVILPCNGDRVFSQTQDHEMAFSFPWKWADTIMEGLEGTHKGGVRYPIPTFLQYSPSYPKHYLRMDEIWEEMAQKRDQ